MPTTVLETDLAERPRRLRPRLSVDAEKVVDSVERRAKAILEDRDRGEWMEARIERYAKFRGWLEPKTYPYEGAANVHLPLLFSFALRQDGGLYNVIATTRPLFTAKAQQGRNIDRAGRATELVDAQLFLETPDARRRLGDFITNFVLDGNAVAFTPWVRNRRRVVTTKFLPPLPPGLWEYDYLQMSLAALFPNATGIAEASPTGLDFMVSLPGGEAAQVMVYHGEDGGFELEIHTEATVFDGPVFIVLDIEDVLIRSRVANLQPPSPQNPLGAPEVIIRTKLTVDEIRRLKAEGRLNRLGDEDLDKIVQTARGGVPAATASEELAEQKDTIEGVEHRIPETTYEEETGHLPVDCYMVFDRWDVEGRGLQDDTYWLIAREARVLMEARRLTELWPATEPYRPLAEASFIPVPNRYYGISLLEIGESIYDLVTSVVNLSIDAGKFGNIPPFFYSTNAAWREGTLRYAPGEGIPVPGDPRAAVYFPTIASRDQSWAFNLISTAYQFLERAMMISDVQFGRVPIGRASALRTMGTTVSLLQQGDVRADQVLIRLLGGLAQVARNYHRMNRAFLPPDKEYRIWGYVPEHKEPYRQISFRNEIDADLDFEWNATFLASNPGALAQVMQSILTVVATPLLMQMGLTDTEKIYNLVSDYIKATRQEPSRYLKEPSQAGAPSLLAEEAISMILSGEVPLGRPLEGAQAHMEKLSQFMVSDKFGFLTPDQVGVFKGWLRQVGIEMAQERQAQAAAQMQQTLLQSGAGLAPGGMTEGAPPQPGEGPAVPEASVNAEGA